MSKVFGKTPASTLLIPVISFAMLLFVGPSKVYTQAPKDSRSRQAESGAGRRFLSALEAYKAQHYTTAQSELQSLVKSLPNNFDVNELLGLVYVEQGKQEEANRFLEKAVLLRPNVAEARTALATNLLALQRGNEAELQFKRVVQLEPHSYDANHNLGEFYIQSGKIGNAIPFLKRAQEINPEAYDNGYDLALALDQTGQFEDARQQLQKLISLRNSAEIHSLLGEVEEKLQNYVSSAAQYEQAARLEPNEQNIFNWGAELLLHQTFEPAIEVFKTGTQHFPQSAQLQNGLGTAYYGAGQMDDAVRAFFRASDLTPGNPLPVIFLGKTCDEASPPLAAQVRSRLQSFVNRDTQNAEIMYYLAICLWRSNQIESDDGTRVQIASLLRRASTLDPNYADAYFQLGNLYAEQHEYKEAIEQYDRAIKINGNSANIHYRLGQALARTGNGARAQAEFAIFDRLRKSELDATNKEQNQIQQFVYTMRKSDTNQQ